MADDALAASIAHANNLLNDGEPDKALAFVTGLSPDLITTDDHRRSIADARHRAFLAIMNLADAQGRWHVFNHAQRYFYYAARDTPDAPYLYEQYAEQWACAGHADMARRIAASTKHVFPETEVDIDASTPRFDPPAYGTWTGAYRPRTLIIAHDGADYGVDTLFDGLCTLLGSDRVTDFPFKPGLHGRMTHEQCRYPCLFDYPGEPWPIQELAQALLAGEFDLVVYADAIGRTNHTAVKALVKAATGKPIVFYDAGDDCHDMQREMCTRAGIDSCLAYFKREMLDAIDYGPNAWPLPFAYSESYCPQRIDTPRTDDLFWAGTAVFGMRPLYLPRLERARGRSLSTTYTQEEYTAALLRSRVGLSLFGWGFDTVRYWEVPAHGAMLLAERPPIHIPNNFVDGESAMFFDDLAELEEKLAYLEAHPEEAAAIAARGHAHFQEHHLASTRARQLLGTIESLLSDRN